MRADPQATVQVAAEAIAGLDREYALEEWRTEEEAAVFGSGDGDAGAGPGDPMIWQETIAWRREVAGWERDLQIREIRTELAHADVRAGPIT